MEVEDNDAEPLAAVQPVVAPVQPAPVTAVGPTGDVAR